MNWSMAYSSGNWLSAEQSAEVLRRADGDSMRAKRDYAMLAMLFGCGFRRSELVGLGTGRDSDASGPLGCRGPDRQGRPHSHRTHSALGKNRSRPVDRRCQCHGGQSLPSGRPQRKNLGTWHLAERCVVCGQELLSESRLGPHCTPRPAQDLCKAVPRPWWRA